MKFGNERQATIKFSRNELEYEMGQQTRPE